MNLKNHDRRGRALARQGLHLAKLRQEAGELIARRLDMERELKLSPLWRLEAALEVVDGPAKADLAWVIERRKRSVRRRSAQLLARAKLFEGASLPIAGASAVLGQLVAPFVQRADLVGLAAALVGGIAWAGLRFGAYLLEVEAREMATAIGEK